MAINPQGELDWWCFDTADGTTYNSFPSLSPPSDFSLLAVYTFEGGGSPEQPSSIGGTNGWNFAWTHVTGITWDTDRRIDVYKSSNPAGGANGVVSVTYTNAMDGCGLSCISFPVTAGEVLDVQQSGTNSGSTATSGSVSLTSPSDVTVGFGGNSDDSSLSGGSGFTDDGFNWAGSMESTRKVGFWSTSATNPVDFSWNTNADWALVALEVGEGGGGGTSLIGPTAGEGGIIGTAPVAGGGIIVHRIRQFLQGWMSKFLAPQGA